MTNSTGKMTELSVIIVSFNVKDYLKQCLHTVIRASENINCQIFVVDNNSDDETCSMVEKEFPDVRLLKNRINSGFSASCNQAIKVAEGRFILLLNPDTLIEEDTLIKCMDFMDKHPEAGATGVRMVNGSGRFLPESKRAYPTPAVAFYKIFGLAYLFPHSSRVNKYYLSDIDSFETSETDIVSGAFMLISHEALKKTGLLDEDFFMYGEDIDLSYRLVMTGYKNFYFAGTQIVHFKGKSTGRNNCTDILHFYKAMRLFVMKRVREGKYSCRQYFIIPAIFFRELLALTGRLLRILISH
jgi:GT2 family glycosyltransferase